MKNTRRLTTVRCHLVSLVLACLATGCGTDQPIQSNIVPPAEAGLVVYDAEVWFDLENGSMDVLATFSFVLDDTSQNVARLLVNRGLQIRELGGVGVGSYSVSESEFSPQWHLVEVALEESRTDRSSTTLRLSYGGQLDFPSDGINGISPEWVELNLDSQWLPTMATLDHDMVGDLRIHLPPDWQLASSGAVGFEDGLHSIQNRVRQVDAAFVAAPVMQQVTGELYTVYFRGGDQRSASAVLDAATNCGQYLNGQFGARNPLPAGSIILADRQGPGYARKNYIVLSEVNVDDSDGLHFFLCHELAHYWSRSPGPLSPHHWMSEAFAEYVAAMYLREHVGQSVFEQRRSQWEEVGRAHGPVWTPEATERPSFFAMYRRAPYLLSRLEERVGEQLFKHFIEGFMVEGFASTPELLDHLALVAGRDEEQWFRAELAAAPTR